jgi:HD-GYP domain-containing protein (c-di-GMP phosphodiesterase class II)
MFTRDASRITRKLTYSYSDLSFAYDSTLEVLSNALDLRDREAKGHAQRVIQSAVALAKLLRVEQKELEHIRRGALLHDIGNLLVPESILYKKDELTAEEWVIIHMHPFNAFEMLESIVFLRPALEIPYRHHEKWDGSGYPRGLKGDQIPLAARIFSVVDVFDSMTSDRPYRKALPKSEAVDYIREEAGKHFDPGVAEVFLSNPPWF